MHVTLSPTPMIQKTEIWPTSLKKKKKIVIYFKIQAHPCLYLITLSWVEAASVVQRKQSRVKEIKDDSPLMCVCMCGHTPADKKRQLR